LFVRQSANIFYLSYSIRSPTGKLRFPQQSKAARAAVDKYSTIQKEDACDKTDFPLSNSHDSLLAIMYEPPAASPVPPPMNQPTSDATGGVIPYKNPQALTSYYLGVFSLIPLLGLLLGCVAVPLGIIGLRKRKTMPQIRGTAHAWVGIILGGLSVLGHLAIIAMIFLPK
jgi:hypothetical protein